MAEIRNQKLHHSRIQARQASPYRCPVTFAWPVNGRANCPAGGTNEPSEKQNAESPIFTDYNAASQTPNSELGTANGETITSRTSTSIQERRAFFGCDMNTWEPKIHGKLPISQHIDRQDLATSVHGETKTIAVNGERRTKS